MDQWAASFEEKSERRRRRNRRERLIKGTMLAIVLVAMIGAAFWATITIVDRLASL
jgi:hypothetical protein